LRQDEYANASGREIETVSVYDVIKEMP